MTPFFVKENKRQMEDLVVKGIIFLNPTQDTMQKTPQSTPAILLASSSTYRRALLKQLRIPFEYACPDIDESAHPGESPTELANRLAQEKAMTFSTQHHGLIIASDQVATRHGQLLGKPGSTAAAIEQLRACSGKHVTFLTSLFVLNSGNGEQRHCLEPYHVQFRLLNNEDIERYVALDQPLDCAGSFKLESLGVNLFESISGNDPNALIGLPLIKLCQFLRELGYDPLLNAR